MLREPPVPVLLLSFRDCELHCCHLDGYRGYRKSFLNRLEAVDSFFAGEPAGRRYRIWYNLDESGLDRELMEAVALSLTRMKPRVVKIAFVGVRPPERWRFERLLAGAVGKGALPRRYFSDAEQAKEWLV